MAGRLQTRVYSARPEGAGAGLLSAGAWLGQVRQDLADLGRFRHVLRNFVVTDLKVRYQRSVLGFLWTLLNPILMMVVLAVVFSQVLRTMGIEEYPLYLFSGFIPWIFFSSVIVSGSNSLLANEFLIKTVQVPKFLFPLRCLLVGLVNFVFEILALCILFVCFGEAFRVQVVLLPAAVVLLAVFALGIMFITASLVTRYRDFEHIIGVFLQAWYFLTPILYPESLVKDYAWLLRLNPMVYLMRIFHCTFYHHPASWPDPTTWLAAVVAAFGTLLIGYGIYKRCEPHYVFWL